MNSSCKIEQENVLIDSKKVCESLDFSTLKGSELIQSFLIKSTNKADKDPNSLHQSHHKISHELLKSLDIIKETTDSLLNASPRLNKIENANGFSDSLENLMMEIQNLEMIIRDNSLDVFKTKNITSFYPDQYPYQQDLETLIFTDMVTQLPNRRFFEAFIKELFSSAIERFYVIFIDLDDFKGINDTYGHECGDILLRAIGERIRRHLRDNDIVVRYGGDEFVALVHHKADINIEQILKRMVDINLTPYDIKGHSITLTISVGVSIFPDHGHTTAELLSCADSAMYRTKGAGKNSFTMA